MSGHFELPVVPLCDSGNGVDHLLHQAADWYAQVSRGLCTIGFRLLPPAQAPRPMSWYAAMSGGKGAWPRNTQALALEALPADLRLGRRLIILTGRELLPHTWFLPRGFGDSRYTVLPADSTLGTAAHELGHLLFHWPDWQWPKACESDCLMARGALAPRTFDPSPPCAPLLVRQGWHSPVPVLRATLVEELAEEGVGVFEWCGRAILVELRRDGEPRLMIYGPEPAGQVTRVELAAEDGDRTVLGLIGPALRSLLPAGK